MPAADKGKNKKNLMFEGKTGTAEAVYAKIFRQAKDSIILIDRELSIKTLELIGSAKAGVPVLIYSDNEGGHPLSRQSLKDFFGKNAGIRLLIGTIAGKCKGRYIVIDSGTPEEKVYLLSGSPSTAGGEDACIILMEDTQLAEGLLKELEKNAYLVLQ